MALSLSSQPTSLERLQAMERRHEGVAFHDLRDRVVRGEPGAWRVFVERYSSLVYTLALRLAPGGSDREEMAHEIYLAAFRRLAGNGHRLLREFRGDARFETYLFALVRNEVSHQRRSLARLRHREVPLDGADRASGSPGPVPLASPAGFAGSLGLDTERVARIVEEAMGRLTGDERLVLRLRFREGLPLRRLAEIFRWKDTNAAAYEIVKILRKLDLVERCRRAFRWGEPEEEVVLTILRRMLETEGGMAGEASTESSS